MQKLNCILLVDDDPGTHLINRFLLKKHELASHVFEARDGIEALEFIKTQASLNGNGFGLPDLIFLDLKMPLMDGFEFLENYKKLKPELKKSVIVVVSSSDRADDKLKVMAFENVKSFYKKPLNTNALQTLWNKYFHD